MILNVIPDQKFTPFLQSVFEEAGPAVGLFRIVTGTREPEFASAGPMSELVPPGYVLSKQFEEDARRASCVVFHGMTAKYAIAAARIPRDIPILWRGWGFDYYPLLATSHARLLLDGTRSMQKGVRLREALRSPLRAAVGSISRLAGRLAVRRIVARVDYFSCCVPDDFIALHSAVPRLKAAFLPLNYYSCEDVFLVGSSSNMAGPDILVGNSATPENNHLEVIEHLARLGTGGRKVIVPLSYGRGSGSELYAAAVRRAGERLLGDAFVALDHFFPLAKYNQLLERCGTVVMNSVRQQAVGNVSAAVLRGARVFLRDENPLSRWYSGVGVKLFRYPHDLTLDRLQRDMEPMDRAVNRQLMTQLWTRGRAIQHVRGLAARVEHVAASEFRPDTTVQ